MTQAIDIKGVTFFDNALKTHTSSKITFLLIDSISLLLRLQLLRFVIRFRTFQNMCELIMYVTNDYMIEWYDTGEICRKRDNLTISIKSHHKTFSWRCFDINKRTKKSTLGAHSNYILVAAWVEYYTLNFCVFLHTITFEPNGAYFAIAMSFQKCINTLLELTEIYYAYMK